MNTENSETNTLTTPFTERPWLTALRQAGVDLRMEDDSADTSDTSDDEGSQEQADDSGTPATILIDGVEMTAEEIRQGMMRQADYTKKSQANAEAIRIGRAIQEDPETVLRELGYDVGDDDPTSNRISQLERALAEQTTANQLRELRVSADKAATKHKLDIDADALLEFAASTNVLNLDAAAELFSVRSAAKKAANNSKVIAGRKAGDPTSGGSTRQAGDLKPNETGMTLEQKMRADMAAMFK